MERQTEKIKDNKYREQLLTPIDYQNSTAMCLPVIDKQSSQHGQKRLMDISNVQFMYFLNISIKICLFYALLRPVLNYVKF